MTRNEFAKNRTKVAKKSTFDASLNDRMSEKKQACVYPRKPISQRVVTCEYVNFHLPIQNAVIPIIFKRHAESKAAFLSMPYACLPHAPAGP